MFNKLISLTLVFMIVVAGFAGLSASAYEVQPKGTDPSGKCGDNVTWELNMETGTLTISGTGDVYYNYLTSDFGSEYEPDKYYPWRLYKDNIKEIIINHGITSFGGDAFSGLKKLKSVTIPNSVTKIPETAFWWCISLDSIEIPDTVTEIGDKAFYGCTSLESITIPDSVTKIGFETLFYCNNLKSINVDKNNSNYSSIDGVLFNKTKTEILQYPNGKTDLSYEIPIGVTSIGYGAFWRCKNLKHITIPNSTNTINDYAFSACENLESIIIPDGVKEIGFLAFICCTSLKSINIPASVTEIGNGAFACVYRSNDFENGNFDRKNMLLYAESHLENINVDGSNAVYSSLNGVLFNKKKTTIIQYPLGNSNDTYTIPDSVTEISDNAFTIAANLMVVTIPGSVTKIGSASFAECGKLKSITVPNSVTEIGDEAFSMCDNLTLFGYSNSYVERYADKHSIPFVTIISDTEYKETNTYGDIDGDGKITMSDVVNIQQFLANLHNFTSTQKQFADVNGDGNVTMQDVVLVQKYIAELINKF